jgi:1,2-dihydroxy-3-keto-5-methylthiopentene dioxygenase
MTTLSVYQQSAPELPSKVLTHVEDIASTLAEVGVRFACWSTTVGRPVDNSVEVVLATYQEQIAQLMNETGLVVVDVLRHVSEHPQQLELRAALLQERRHAGDYVYWCVAGRGLFALHIDEQVFEVLCGKGDLIALPAGTKHWLDIGEKADFIAVRLCGSGEAGIAHVTGDPISERFNRLEEWM